MISIPSEFAELTITREGEAGRTWIERLPGVMASHLDRWALTGDGPVMHGFVGIALPVVTASGEPAVLKVSWQEGDVDWEARALAAWNGRGAVRLLECDEPAGVLLLERLDPARSTRGSPPVWTPPPSWARSASAWLCPRRRARRGSRS